jgi:Fic family protein
MNDTNNNILSLFNKETHLSSSEVHSKLKDVSLVTVKRRLSELTEQGLLAQTGAGRSVKYTLSKSGLLLKPIGVKDYLSKDADNRNGKTLFNVDLFDKPYIALFSEDELSQLDAATENFHNNAKHADSSVHSKELLRFIIEFSWKTSQIEGNTYDLLSTERLLRFGEKSKNNTEFETQMILNQKQALESILENLSTWQEPTVSQLEQLHTIVGNNLNITRNLRKGLVGITGTNYRPLDNEFQIREAMDKLFKWVQSTDNFYEKSLLCVLGISYIQPFVDGNKRTSRLIGNAILLSGGLAPLSYRSVDDKDYKESMLVFYEQNSLTPFKELFIEQYKFATENYNLLTE